MLNRRCGVSLPELIVALVLTGLVSGLVVALVGGTHRIVRRQAGRLEVERSLRAASVFLTRELAAIAGGPDTDLLLAAPDRVHYRALRGLGFSCGVRGDTLLVRRRVYYAVRAWQPSRDRLQLFVAGDSARGRSPRWVGLPLVGVHLSRCADGAPALALATSFPAGIDPTADIAPGAPVRVVEPSEIRHYQSAGAWWLGLRSLAGGGSIQPALGPLASSGLSFRYWDRSENTTAAPSAVAGLTIQLEAHPSHRSPSGLSDSQVVRLTLRNLP